MESAEGRHRQIQGHGLETPSENGMDQNKQGFIEEQKFGYSGRRELQEVRRELQEVFLSNHVLVAIGNGSYGCDVVTIEIGGTNTNTGDVQM